MTYFWKAFVLQLRQVTTYRTNLFFSGLADLIPMLGLILFVSGVVPDDGAVHGFSKPELVAYYIFILLLAGWIPDVGSVSRNIRSGEITAYLLRPRSYFGYSITRSLGVQVFSLLIYLCFFVLVAVAGQATGLFASLTGPGVMTVVVSSIVAFVLAFQFGYLINLAAYWLEDVAGILAVTYLIRTVLCGQLFPLDFLSASLRSALMLTPFPYMYYFPARILIGASSEQVVQGLLTGAGWIVVLGAVMRVAWFRGLARYDARGG